MSEAIPQSNSFSALDESQPVVQPTQPATQSTQPVRQRRERRYAKVFGTGEFQTQELSLDSTVLVNTMDQKHYLELAQEAINCLCERAKQNINYRLQKMVSGTTSMNVLGPVFKDEFYIRLNPTKWAIVTEQGLKTGKVTIDDVEYQLNNQNAIRIWDVIAGPIHHPTLFREQKMLSLGEKLQSIVQKDTHAALVKEGRLKPDDEYKPSVWLFLAYRKYYGNRQEPCRFISMNWGTKTDAQERLLPVSEYCTKRTEHKNDRQNTQGQKPKKNFHEKRTDNAHLSKTQQADNRPRYDTKSREARKTNSAYVRPPRNAPEKKPELDQTVDQALEKAGIL